MKKLIVSATLLTLSLTACNNASNTLAPIVDVNDANVQAAANMSNHHPDFARKLRNPSGYVFKENRSIKSICGQNDLQHVNSYDGSLGQSVEFVKKHEKAVGALARGNSSSSSKFCSGTLISEDLFLTASHCIDSAITDKDVAFNYQTAKGSSTLLEQEHFKVAEVVEDGNNGLDYSVIRLEGAPGKKYGWTSINPELPEDGHLLTIIQHPKGQPKQVEVGHKAGVAGSYMTYGDLDTEPGSSGSGVLDDNGKVVGVHTNGGCFSSGGANKAVKMSEIYSASDIVKKIVAARRISRR